MDCRATVSELMQRWPPLANRSHSKMMCFLSRLVSLGMFSWLLRFKACSLELLDRQVFSRWATAASTVSSQPCMQKSVWNLLRNAWVKGPPPGQPVYTDDHPCAQAGRELGIYPMPDQSGFELWSYWLPELEWIANYSSLHHPPRVSVIKRDITWDLCNQLINLKSLFSGLVAEAARRITFLPYIFAEEELTQMESMDTLGANWDGEMTLVFEMLGPQCWGCGQKKQRNYCQEWFCER